MNVDTLRRVWLPFGGLVLSSVVAVALLWWPETLSELSWKWRLPLMVLGAWALGAGFMHGVGLTTTRHWGRRLMAVPVYCWGLAGFALFVLGRLVTG